MSRGRAVSGRAATIAAIVLGIICAFIAILWIGTVLYYSSVIFEKNLQIYSLNSTIAERNAEISRLKSEMEAKDSMIQSLRNEIDYLKNAMASLNSEIAERESQIASLKSQIVKLNGSYLLLKSDYDSLKQDYDKLLSAIERAEVVAKSATWLSEDKRVNVASEVIPNFFFGEIYSYTIRVTVTNVGAEPLNTVWIILIPYQDGKLIKDWSPYWYSETAKSLYMGESYSCEFTSIPKEMTTYKIVIIAG